MIGYRKRYDISHGIQKIKTRTFFAASGLVLLFGGTGMSLAVFGTAHADSTVVVTPANQQGWSTADTRPGGNVTYVTDSSAPGGSALRLTTDSTTTSKAQYLENTDTALSSITELSYMTKQNSASFTQGDPSFQLPVLLNGNSGFTTLVYEPYQGGQGSVVNGTWQTWNIFDGGLFWSSHAVTCSGGTVNGTSGGPATYTLAQIQTMCPDAVAFQFGVNIGSNNPSYDTEVDTVNFNGTIYNFQNAAAPVTLTSKDQCKNNGWATANDPSFKNQGDCVSYFATNGKNLPDGSTTYDHFVYGSLTLNSPEQQLNFFGDSASGTGSFTYTNTNPSFSYTTNLTCVNISGNTAYMTYQIPSNAAYAANVWVVWKVVDNGSSDTAGFTTAADMASANALCSSGTASVTNYPVIAGDVIVN